MAQNPVEWADRIGAVSDQYKNASVTILNPALVVTTSYDPETNQYATTGDPVIATGIAARVQPVRLSVDASNTGTGNPAGEVRIRVQIPRTAYSGRISRGWQIRVDSADRNPELTDYIFYVDSHVGSSWRASNTIECTTNVENVRDA